MFTQAVSVIKSLGGNVKMLVTSPKEEEENKNKPGGWYFFYVCVFCIKGTVSVISSYSP